jgi:homoserine kinase
MKMCLKDFIIEPQRKQLIPGFDSIQSAALQHGALGCSISGSGPSIFAFATSEDEGRRIESAMKKAALNTVDTWVMSLPATGACVLPG